MSATQQVADRQLLATNCLAPQARAGATRVPSVSSSTAPIRGSEAGLRPPSRVISMSQLLPQQQSSTVEELSSASKGVR